MSIDTGVDPENPERGPAGTLTSYKIDTTGLLIFRGKKSKISRDFQGQIRGKIGRFRRIFAGKKSKFAGKSADFMGNFGGKLRQETISKNSRFCWIFWGQIQLKSISFASI